MSFKVGDTVVYPHHGAARIEAVETRTIKGEDKTYLVLKVDKGDLTVRVAGEKRMLAKARQILVSELALAEKTNEDKAEALLDEILASGPPQPVP
jgi:RNA polymerase-interacting CarD/CdnL/TRCF family regulator